MICSRWAVHATPAQGQGPTTAVISHAGSDETSSARLERVVGTPPASRSVSSLSCLISRHWPALLFRPACQENCRSGHTPAEFSSRVLPLGISVHLGCTRLVPESVKHSRLTEQYLASTTVSPLSAARHLCDKLHIQIGRLRPNCDRCEYR